MGERTNRGLEGCRENLVKFFGEENVMGVYVSSERFSWMVSRLIRGYLTIVICDVFALVFTTCDEGLVEEGSGS